MKASIMGKLTEIDLDKLSGKITVPGKDTRVSIVFPSIFKGTLKALFGSNLKLIGEYVDENLFNVSGVPGIIVKEIKCTNQSPRS